MYRLQSPEGSEQEDMNMTLLLAQNKASHKCMTCIGSDEALDPDRCWQSDAICALCGHYRTWVKVPCPYGNCPFEGD